jgi:hypothetical protein
MARWPEFSRLLFTIPFRGLPLTMVAANPSQKRCSITSAGKIKFLKIICYG